MRIGSNLLNWLKSKTYLKDEVDSKISQIASAKLSRLVVEELPETGENNIIYLVPNDEGDDPYTEYLYDESGWNMIGSTQIDLSDYYTGGEVDGLLREKSDVCHSHDVSTIMYRNSDVGSALDNKAENSLVTSSKNGLMGKDDKIKLDSVSADADKVEFLQVQGDGSKIGTIKINDSAVDIFAPSVAVDGALSSVSENPVQNKVLNSALNNKANLNHSHDDYYTKTQADNLLNGKSGNDVATDESNGLMSKEDKIKLDSVSSGADNVEFTRSHDNGIKIGAIKINGVSTDIFAPASDEMEIIEYGVATVSSDGLMSSSDKVKLNGISSNADNVEFTRVLNTGTKIGTITINGAGVDLYVPSIDSSLSSTSTNPVQNKVVNSALNNKANLNHTHNEYFTQDEAVYEFENITETLEEKANIIHSHSQSDIIGLATSLNGKAEAVHSHEMTDIANLTSTLNSKAGTNVATTEVNGLFSKEDKAKLEGIEANANNVTVDSALSSTSRNPLENRVINVALTNKAEVSHSHDVTTIMYRNTDVGSALDNKAENAVVTSSKNGLMSSSDKTKLDGIQANATKNTDTVTLTATLEDNSTVTLTLLTG